ncbi:hypothetical protein [Microbacterium amylolyticum]|uniref:AcrR family transcriptional regulator n=1 Tax=Microbacterium amylolyticum TaxID=936337 RepID=A0ABS4ZGC4_9MICO|nr:hypothetical protein [Microbacterium amylolyticum]MBP2436324.1 AcrR family transcriptional regulator [Microbacterium amylolyticum]
MRRLAGVLGAGAMSLYHYVANKDELLDAMIDLVFEEIELPPEDVYLPQLPPEEFPYLNESAAELTAAGYDPAEEFIFGLDLVLAALEPLRSEP